jgi:hypothetical protein
MYQISPYWWSHLAWHCADRKYAKYLDRHKGTNVIKVMKYVGVNTEMACIIMREYLDAYDGDYEKALLKFGGFNVKRYRNSPLKDYYIKRVMGHDL